MIGVLLGLGFSFGAPTELVWADEFDSAELDQSKWGYQFGNGQIYGIAGWGNNELEYYTDRSENVSLRDGNLVITARKEKYDGDLIKGGSSKTYTWTSGRIRTAGKFSATYGKVEIRAKLPKGKGLWPAIWMLPEDDRYGQWASSGEIDIVEGKGAQLDKMWQTIHFGGGWPNNKYSGWEFTFPKGEGIDGWHVYTLEWNPTSISWYIDGNLTSTKTEWYSTGKDATGVPFPAPFDQPFHLIVNLAVGGNFGGNVDSSTPKVAEMFVDYIRWTQR